MARILLIDDDDAVRGILGEMLARSGHTVIEARDGEEGLELFEHAAADLVITDMVMPRKSGRAVIRELLARQPLVKIIAMSGGGRPDSNDTLGQATLAGAAEVLNKPFTLPALLQTIDEVLRTGQGGALDGPRCEVGV
jgi:CheY-like chemotaxis protein